MSPANSLGTTRTRLSWTGARLRLTGPLAMFVGAVILVIGSTAFSDSQSPSGAGVGVATPAQVATNWDSVYTAIQQNYTQVAPIIERGCFDCHSTKTVYPWYHKLPVIKGWLDEHIEHARKHLDLTDGFPFKGHSRAADNLLAMRNQVLEGHMPPFSYRIMHWSAKPGGDDLDSLIAWIDTSLRTLAAHGQYPLGRPDLVPMLNDAGE